MMLMSPENLLVIFDVEFVSKNLQPQNRQMVQDFSNKTMYTTQFFTKNDCLLHSLLQHCFLKKKQVNNSTKAKQTRNKGWQKYPNNNSLFKKWHLDFVGFLADALCCQPLDYDTNSDGK